MIAVFGAMGMGALWGFGHGEPCPTATGEEGDRSLSSASG